MLGRGGDPKDIGGQGRVAKLWGLIFLNVGPTSKFWFFWTFFWFLTINQSQGLCLFPHTYTLSLSLSCSSSSSTSPFPFLLPLQLSLLSLLHFIAIAASISERLFLSLLGFIFSISSDPFAPLFGPFSAIKAYILLYYSSSGTLR